jgi:hypothetical protein
MTWRRMSLREDVSGLMVAWSVATMNGSDGSDAKAGTGFLFGAGILTAFQWRLIMAH